MKSRLRAQVVNGMSAVLTRRDVGWASWGNGSIRLHEKRLRLVVISVSVCFVSSRPSRQRCMSAWWRQWRVSDQQDGTEVAVCHQQMSGWRQKEFQSNIREVQSRESVKRIWPRIEPYWTTKKHPAAGLELWPCIDQSEREATQAASRWITLLSSVRSHSRHTQNNVCGVQETNP